MGKLDGRVAFITGGSRGQGRSHAVHLAQQGADIVLVDVPDSIESVPYALGTEAELQETAALVEKEGRRAVTIRADVRRSDQMRAAADTAVAEFGKIDIALANAGIVTYHQLAAMDDQAWQDTIDVNLTGAANTLRAVLPTMIDRQYGRIVVTSSTAGRIGLPNLSHYCAAKWGLIGLVKSVALETAPLGGITCNAITPGTVDTPMMHHEEVYRTFAPDLESPTVTDLEERMRLMNTMSTAWIQPGDISHAVAFLASEEARYITGTVIDVSAGFGANNSA